MPGKPSKSSKPSASGIHNKLIFGRLRNCTLKLKSCFSISKVLKTKSLYKPEPLHCGCGYMLWLGSRVQSSAIQDAFCLWCHQPTHQPQTCIPPAGSRQETKAEARNGCKYCAMPVEMFKIPSDRRLPCRWSKAVNISPVGNHDSPPHPPRPPGGNNLFQSPSWNSRETLRRVLFLELSF